MCLDLAYFKIAVGSCSAIDAKGIHAPGAFLSFHRQYTSNRPVFPLLKRCFCTAQTDHKGDCSSLSQ